MAKAAKPKGRARAKPKGRAPAKPKGRAPAKSRSRVLGGYQIVFKGSKDTFESIFGPRAIDTSQMTKKLWTYVKQKNRLKRV